MPKLFASADSDCEDILNLPNHAIYLKLMIDGTPSRPFSTNTMHWYR